MPATRSSLVSQAQTIRSETAEGANTAERVGALLEEHARIAMLLSPLIADQECWIDNTNGDDEEGAGSVGAPWASLDRVFEEYGDEHLLHNVKVNVAGSATPYNCNALFRTRVIEKNFWMKGSGFDQVVGPVAVTAHAGAIVTCAGAAWVAEAYTHLFVELIRANGTILGYATILENTATTLKITGAKGEFLSGAATIRIVRPAVKFSRGARTTSTAEAIQGGVFSHRNSYVPNGMCWENIEMVSIGADYNTYKFSGNHIFVGLLISGAASNFGQTFRCTASSNIWAGAGYRAGTFYSPVVSEPAILGWGLSMLDTATPAFAGYVALEGGFFRGAIAAGTLFVSDGANVRLENGTRFRETYGDGNWANITVMRNCTCEMSGTVVLGQAGGTEDQLYVEESNLVLWPTTQWTLKNSGQFIHNRHGFVTLTGGEAAHTPVVENGGNRLLCYFDGQIRLTAGLFSTPGLFAWLGQTQCGSIPADAHIRPAGPWDAGDWTSDVAARDAINAAADLAALKVVLARLSRHDGSKIGRSS